MTATSKTTTPEQAPAQNLTEALARVQTALPVIGKNKTAKVVMKGGGEYSYKYADLADIQPVVLPLLAAQGLTWTSKPTVTPNGFGLVYALRHVSGEVEEGEYPLPDPRARGAQEVGSAITYARRYTFCCAIGIVPDEDEDGRLSHVGDATAKEDELERERARAQARREEQEEDRRQNEAREAARLNAQVEAIARLRTAHDALYPDFTPVDRDGSIQRLIVERKWDRTNPAHLTKLAEELEEIKAENDATNSTQTEGDKS